MSFSDATQESNDLISDIIRDVPASHVHDFESEAWLDSELLDLDNWRSQRAPQEELFLLTRKERERQRQPQTEVLLEDIINVDALTDEIDSSDPELIMPPAKRTRHEQMSPHSLLQGLHHMATSPITSTHLSDYTEEVTFAERRKQIPFTNPYNRDVLQEAPIIDVTTPDYLPRTPSPVKEHRKVTPITNAIKNASKSLPAILRPEAAPFSFFPDNTSFFALRGGAGPSIGNALHGGHNFPSSSPITSPSPRITVVPDVEPDTGRFCVPAALKECGRLQLPQNWRRPTTVHRYISSMSLARKRALRDVLQSDQCWVDLVERTEMRSPDLVVDPDTGIIFHGLANLPMDHKILAAELNRLSWRFQTIVVIFEAFRGYRTRDLSTHVEKEVYPFTEPVSKVIGRLRRNLGIAEGTSNKSPGCSVFFAFARDPEEAALITRFIGDEAERHCPLDRSIWDDRAWLQDESWEGEDELAQMDTMNYFAANVILCRADFNAFLDMDTESRFLNFGRLIGVDRMVSVVTI
ncbi:hypothetical protein SISSUDRAFT_1010232 [Sistotremastrum suecicum HHB10207 ss-3]|uniref:Uncharacterized protein n=1 Tax=Sistotremastrum suecicum HHB10207 ss-3 TaxID=1314776 RepID=A0A165ZD06_9AGAM|nr:hypothetical protein SISSUDRAFT_1010232 [Sistotremastrum suecicum HHB10207 ss-3]